ncbi:hypothetical protein GA0116948_110138 [Chitinophaga costaii]|uniref:Uncharacterized protein n=1 Tax=Chitinophaga costaii TaxID=1335309 RepID=A0A1C4EYR0_9BACT|nr:hypothetical protein [Chitinophaga costaii]PUZ21530.1 hypothetical protein DCM91_15955 [Chitinophaga costaii]SCC48889.1 hypothetical protein GA0116948_110138 [Chitinophaga costaii]
MHAPFTQVLIRSFGKGFYRVHAGLLLFFFVAVVSYCFFINYAGTIPTSQITVASLVITLTFITSPFMMGAVFVVWALYAFKSWQYVAAQLSLPASQYLFYSATAFSRRRQFFSWYVAQLFIMLPALAYVLFALVLGGLYGHLQIPLWSLCYLLVLVAVSAGGYVVLANRLPGGTSRVGITRQWRKPFFSLFIYQLIHQHKVSWVLIKTASLAVMWYVALHGVQDFRALQLVVLLFVMAHVYLLYQDQRFETFQLKFGLNFPYSRSRLFAFLALRYAFIFLPEIGWLWLCFSLPWALLMTVWGLSMLVCLRSLLYVIGLHTGVYLRWVFVFFIGMFWGVMYGQVWACMALCLGLSAFWFYRFYYRGRSLV